MSQLKPLERPRHLLIWQPVDDFHTGLGQSADASWQISHCRDFDHLKTLKAAVVFDAVLFSVDPTSANSLDDLRRLIAMLADASPTIVTYASFNPRWIGNLMKQVGADVHFAGRPGLLDALAEIDAHSAAGDSDALKIVGDIR